MLDEVSDVENELHVHGGLGYAGSASVDDGDQRSVQFVHVALGQQPTSAARLVLHLDPETEEEGGCWFGMMGGGAEREGERKKRGGTVGGATMSACVEMRRESELMPAEVRTARWGVRALQAARAISFWKPLQDDSAEARLRSGVFSW